MQLIATYATDMYSYLSKGSSEIQIFNFGFLLGEMYIYIYTGSNPGGGEIFRPSRPALRPTQSPVQWVPGLSRG